MISPLPRLFVLALWLAPLLSVISLSTAAVAQERPADPLRRRATSEPPTHRDPAVVIGDILDRSYQTELPSDREAAPRAPIRVPTLFAVPLRLIVLVLTGVAVVILLASVVSDVSQRLRGRASAGEMLDEGGRSAAASPESKLRAAETLAAQGRYAEAIHHLLLTAIGILNDPEVQLFPDSLTSREISRRAALPGHKLDALNRLIRSVEVSRFGSEAADRDEYESCRSSLSVLLHDLGAEART